MTPKHLYSRAILHSIWIVSGLAGCQRPGALLNAAQNALRPASKGATVQSGRPQNLGLSPTTGGPSQTVDSPFVVEAVVGAAADHDQVQVGIKRRFLGQPLLWLAGRYTPEMPREERLHSRRMSRYFEALPVRKVLFQQFGTGVALVDAGITGVRTPALPIFQMEIERQSADVLYVKLGNGIQNFLATQQIAFAGALPVSGGFVKAGSINALDGALNLEQQLALSPRVRQVRAPASVRKASKKKAKSKNRRIAQTQPEEEIADAPAPGPHVARFVSHFVPMAALGDYTGVSAPAGDRRFFRMAGRDKVQRLSTLQTVHKIRVSSNFPESLRRSVQSALEYWNRASGSRIFDLEVAAEGESAARPRELFIQWTTAPGFAMASTQIWVNPENGEVLGGNILVSAADFSRAYELAAQFGLGRTARLTRSRRPSKPEELSEWNGAEFRGIPNAEEHLNPAVIALHVTRELGRILGLRENLAGSLAGRVPLAQRAAAQLALASQGTQPSFSGELSSTVMDEFESGDAILMGARILGSVTPLAYDAEALRALYSATASSAVLAGHELFCSEDREDLASLDCRGGDLSGPVLMSSRDGVNMSVFRLPGQLQAKMMSWIVARDGHAQFDARWPFAASHDADSIWGTTRTRLTRDASAWSSQTLGRALKRLQSVMSADPHLVQSANPQEASVRIAQEIQATGVASGEFLENLFKEPIEQGEWLQSWESLAQNEALWRDPVGTPLNEAQRTAMVAWGRDFLSKTLANALLMDRLRVLRQPEFRWRGNAEEQGTILIRAGQLVKDVILAERAGATAQTVTVQVGTPPAAKAVRLLEFRYPSQTRLSTIGLLTGPQWTLSAERLAEERVAVRESLMTAFKERASGSEPSAFLAIQGAAGSAEMKVKNFAEEFNRMLTALGGAAAQLPAPHADDSVGDAEGVDQPAPVVAPPAGSPPSSSPTAPAPGPAEEPQAAPPATPAAAVNTPAPAGGPAPSATPPVVQGEDQPVEGTPPAETPAAAPSEVVVPTQVITPRPGRRRSRRERPANRRGTPRGARPPASTAVATPPATPPPAPVVPPDAD